MSNETPAPLHRIYRIGPDGVASTLAGAAGLATVEQIKAMDEAAQGSGYRYTYEVPASGEGKEGAGSELTGMILAAKFAISELRQDLPLKDTAENHQRLVSIGKVLRDAAALAAGPRPSSSQPLAPNPQDLESMDALVKDFFDECGPDGFVTNELRGQEFADLWARLRKAIAPESLGGRLIVQSPDAEDQK